MRLYGQGISDVMVGLEPLSQIAMVQLGVGCGFFVVSGASSPQVEFEMKERAPRIIKATETD